MLLLLLRSFHSVTLFVYVCYPIVRFEDAHCTTEKLQSNSFTISCDLVTLLIERQDCLLVDIIGGGDHHVLEPVNLILVPHPLHGLPHHPAQVGQVTTVNADSNSFVTIVIESHGHGAEVEHSTPNQHNRGQVQLLLYKQKYLDIDCEVNSFDGKV